MADLLVDATNLLMRSVFAAQSRSHTSGRPVANLRSNGQSTAALTIFIGMLSSYVRTIEPDRMLLAFDEPRQEGVELHRRVFLPEYKANRGDHSRDDVPLAQAKDFLDACGVAHVSAQTLEADDLLAGACYRSVTEGQAVVLLSGDKDLLQLVEVDRVAQVRVGCSTGDEWWDYERVTRDLGVRPEHYPAYLGLVGDPGDNIPGVPGIGKVTARKILDGYVGDLRDVVLPDRHNTPEGRETYYRCLNAANLRMGAEWEELFGPAPQALPYPARPALEGPLRNFLAAYSMRSLADRVERGLLWRELPGRDDGSLEQFINDLPDESVDA